MANTGQQVRAARGGEEDRDLEGLKADLATLRSELGGVVQAVKGLGESAVATAKRQKDVAVNRITAEAGSLAEEAKSVAADQISGIEARIREQPLAAVGIAFAVGLVFGSLRR